MRIQSLEMNLGENPSLVEFIDEERAGHYTAQLKAQLIEVAHEPAGRQMIDRALSAVAGNPYPRYRDNALVALGVAALAVPDPAWADARLRSILETGLEKEGVTFTFDLAAQLAAEAQRRGIPADELRDYLTRAESAADRWGTRMRSRSARAAADFAQGRIGEAHNGLEQAAGLQDGFAGYLAAHLLALACRWCEFGEEQRVDELGLLAGSRAHAGRVRDPQFAKERGSLADAFEQWLAAPVPDWQAAASLLRATADPDARRAYKDLVSARWSAKGQWADWKHLVTAALADATALDFVLGRLAGHVLREHRDGLREFPDAALAEAISICAISLATSRPWELGPPAYG
jgi:hypothetical protein